MQQIGEVQYIETNLDWLDKYPQLKEGQITIPFTHNNLDYYLQIFYNIQAESLFFNINNDSGVLIQSQTYLATYPTDLLFSPKFLNVSLYFHNNKLYLGERNEIL